MVMIGAKNGKPSPLSFFKNKPRFSTPLDFIRKILKLVSMTIIIAEKYTKRKAIVHVSKKKWIANVLHSFNEKYGGIWAYVDNLNHDEYIIIKDDLKYKGFQENIKRYCSKIESI